MGSFRYGMGTVQSCSRRVCAVQQTLPPHPQPLRCPLSVQLSFCQSLPFYYSCKDSAIRPERKMNTLFFGIFLKKESGCVWRVFFVKSDTQVLKMTLKRRWMQIILNFC